MKLGISIILMISVLGILLACAPKTPKTTEIVVLQDITDTYLTRPNSEELFSLFNFEDKWSGADLKLTDITDVSYNTTTEVKLFAVNEWLSNELDRDKEIEKFKSDVKAVITQYGNDKAGKSHSSIYLPLARALNQLSDNKNQRKVLIVYSDLMENTNDLSFYRAKDLNQLKTQPEQIQEQFEKLLPLKSLSGIEVYFINQPMGDKSDQDFETISKFYRTLLEAKGAKVNVSANINH